MMLHVDILYLARAGQKNNTRPRFYSLVWRTGLERVARGEFKYWIRLLTQLQATDHLPFEWK